MAIPLNASNRIQPRRKARMRTNYNEPDSDSSFDENVARQPVRSLRTGRRIRSYREISDEEAVDLEDQSAEQTAVTSDTDRESLSAPYHNRTADDAGQNHNRLRHSRRHGASHKSRFSHYKRRKLGQPRSINSKSTVPSDPILIPVLGQIPPWQSLEFHIWVDIMQYAAGPVHDNAGRSSTSVEWLLSMSKLCRNFHDAAITALMWSPPLLPADRCHRLLSLLSSSQDSLSVNYSTRIHALDIEVKQLLLRKSGISLEILLRYTPLLQHLRIFHSHDDWVGKHIWAKPGWGRDKWCYGNLIDTLDQNNIILQSFEWNGRFRDTMDAILTGSSKPCLRNLRTVRFVNFVFEEREEGKRISVRDSLADVFHHWPQVHTLEFHNCNILDSVFISQIPEGLRILVVSNCQSLTSEALLGYLSSAGNSLVKLDLSGNQVMDLGFVPNLKTFCHNLQNLRIDLSYEDSSSYRDRDPLYDDLLPNGRPTWPHQLRSLVIGPLRSLSLADAEGFYQSLVDAADDLPYLRILSVKTILQDAGWRDRAKLRSKWTSILNEVFLSKQSYTPMKPASNSDAIDYDSKNTRKSMRIQELEDLQTADDIRTSSAAINIDLEDLPRNKQCRIVEFDLSDQRPAQEQYREEDFLDEELSGDEEWNGG